MEGGRKIFPKSLIVSYLISGEAVGAGRGPSNRLRSPFTGRRRSSDLPSLRKQRLHLKTRQANPNPRLALWGAAEPAASTKALSAVRFFTAHLCPISRDREARGGGPCYNPGP